MRLTEPKRKTLGERDVECIFIGYAEHWPTYMFYLIEPNRSIPVKTVIESKDAIFDENYFTSDPNPKEVIGPITRFMDNLRSVTNLRSISNLRSMTTLMLDHEELPSELSANKHRKLDDDREPVLQVFLVEGSRDQEGSQISYLQISYLQIEEDPRTFQEAMASQDVAFWKEAV